MKYILFLILAFLLILTSCNRITYAYKFSYAVDVTRPDGSIFHGRGSSFYPTRNILTPEEEQCMIDELTVLALTHTPNAYDFRLELVEGTDMESSTIYHCP